MMKILTQSTNIVDSAIGPLSVTTSSVSGFDIDDYVHSQVLSQGELLRMKIKAARADTRYTKNRPPVSIEGVSTGGY